MSKPKNGWCAAAGCIADSAPLAFAYDSVHTAWSIPPTGEATFKALLHAFGDRNIYAGLGTRIAFGDFPHVSKMSARLDAADWLSYRKLMREYDEEAQHVAHRE